MAEVYHLEGNPFRTVQAGDGRRIFAIPQDMGEFALADVEIDVTTVSSAGIVQVQIRRMRAGGDADMLSTRVQIDAGETHSKDAATQPVVNVANAEVDHGDRIAVDVDAAGTGAKGLGIVLTFATGVLISVPPSTQPDFPDAAPEGIVFAPESPTHGTPDWTGRLDVI